MNLFQLRLTDATGLGGIAVAVSALLVIGFGRAWSRSVRWWVGGGLAGLLVLVPIGSLPAAGYLRGFTGDLSVTTVVVVLSALAARGGARSERRRSDRLALKVCLGAVALLLYPLALGAGPFDPYRLGYDSPWLLGAWWVVALAAWFFRRPLLAGCVAAAMLAWAVRGYESTNLWDYLIDPFVALYALGGLLGWSVVRVVAAVRGREGRETRSGPIAAQPS